METTGYEITSDGYHQPERVQVTQEGDNTTIESSWGNLTIEQEGPFFHLSKHGVPMASVEVRPNTAIIYDGQNVRQGSSKHDRQNQKVDITRVNIHGSEIESKPFTYTPNSVNRRFQTPITRQTSARGTETLVRGKLTVRETEDGWSLVQGSDLIDKVTFQRPTEQTPDSQPE